MEDVCCQSSKGRIYPWPCWFTRGYDVGPLTHLSCVFAPVYSLNNMNINIYIDSVHEIDSLNSVTTHKQMLDID